MTDNEIIKALECCYTNDSNDCYKCPYTAESTAEMFCDKKLTRDALDLINRQKAEIETLTKVNAMLFQNADTAYQEGLNEAQALYACEVRGRVRAEAVKEFAETVKANQRLLFNYIYSKEEFAEAIDTLVKEFTEGQE